MSSKIDRLVFDMLLARELPIPAFHLTVSKDRVQVKGRKQTEIFQQIANASNWKQEQIHSHYKKGGHSFLIPDPDTSLLLSRVLNKNYRYGIADTLDLFLEFMAYSENNMAINVCDSGSYILWPHTPQEALYERFKAWLGKCYGLSSDSSGAAVVHMRTHYKPSSYYVQGFEDTYIHMEGFKKPRPLVGEQLLTTWSNLDMRPYETSFTWSEHPMLLLPNVRVEGRSFKKARAYLKMRDGWEVSVSTHAALRYIERRAEKGFRPISRVNTMIEMVERLRYGTTIDWKDDDTLAIYNESWVFLIDKYTKIVKTCYPY